MAIFCAPFLLLFSLTPRAAACLFFPLNIRSTSFGEGREGIDDPLALAFTGVEICADDSPVGRDGGCLESAAISVSFIGASSVRAVIPASIRAVDDLITAPDYARFLLCVLRRGL